MGESNADQSESLRHYQLIAGPSEIYYFSEGLWIIGSFMSGRVSQKKGRWVVFGPQLKKLFKGSFGRQAKINIDSCRNKRISDYDYEGGVWVGLARPPFEVGRPRARPRVGEGRVVKLFSEGLELGPHLSPKLVFVIDKNLGRQEKLVGLGKNF